jgi:hypothetical protein
MRSSVYGAARALARFVVLAGLGVAAGAVTSFLVALLRPQRRATPAYVAPVPPGELKV